MSDRHRTMRLIAYIESGLAGIRCLSEHFEVFQKHGKGQIAD